MGTMQIEFELQLAKFIRSVSSVSTGLAERSRTEQIVAAQVLFLRRPGTLHDSMAIRQQHKWLQLAWKRQMTQSYYL